MRLRDPDNGDYRPLEGSAAEAYGCRSFSDRWGVPVDPGPAGPPAAGRIVSGDTIEVGGLISEDTTWDADLVRVVESVVVASDASLTIVPGARVEFAGYFRLLVHGRLWAVGEAHRRIVLTAAPGQLAEGWDGIEFLNIPAANDSSRLEHCLVSRAVARPAPERRSGRTYGGTSRPETGGAVSIVGVNKLAIASCEFTDNRADYGAAVYCGYGSSPVLAGNLFHGNTAAVQGSVLFNVYAYPKLVNNTIVDNTCLPESEFHLCGAVENFNGKIPLFNNIIRDNHTNHYSGAQVVESKDYYTHGNNISGYEGDATNLDLDPLFYSGGLHPYQLTGGSPCIDTGLANSWQGALAGRDLAGLPRLHGQAIDMGAYEFSGAISPVPGSRPGLPHLSLSCCPNPFNPRTRIEFDIPRTCLVELRVFDLRGRLVRNLMEAELSAGRHAVDWDGRDDEGRFLGSGVYLYRLQAGRDEITRSLTLVR